MANLVGKNINETYQGLIKSCDNNEFGTNNTQLTDGNGNDLALKLGHNASATSTFTGPLIVNANLAGQNGLFDGTAGGNGCVIACNMRVCDKFEALGVGHFGGALSGSSISTTGTSIFNGQTTINNNLSVLGGTTIAGSLSVAGDVTITKHLSVEGDISAFYTSDKKYKENLHPINTTLYFDNLTAYEFDWNESSSKDGIGKGFIAQDIEKIDTSLVHKSNNTLQVDYISFIPILFAEIQSLKAEIEELKNKTRYIGN